MQAEQRPKHVSNLELCLDFTDTVDWRTSDHSKDTLNNYDALLAWGLKEGLMSRENEKRFASLKEDEAPIAKSVMKDAYQLREAVYRIFSTVAHEREADQKDLEVLNKHLAKSLGKLGLRSAGGDYEWEWKDTESPDMMLWPIARSAADLLTSDDLARVRECANEEQGCGSLFLDYSKSQTKKWCSMESCGNRMKVKRYYDAHQRHRKT